MPASMPCFHLGIIIEITKEYWEKAQAEYGDACKVVNENEKELYVNIPCSICKRPKTFILDKEK